MRAAALAAGLAAGVATLGAGSTASADPNVYDSRFAIGGRAGSWLGPYNSPGVGGHLKFLFVDWLGIETFSDNFVWVQEDAWRHDHVIGFSLYAPTLLAGQRWYVSPSFGNCVDFRFAHPIHGDAPSVSDILFGLHGGLMGEAFIGHQLSVQAAATVFAYVGHDATVERWSATVSNALGWSAVAQTTLSANLYF
jgi:hypothetical protein